MNCKKCGVPMLHGQIDGRSGYACMACSSTIVLPMAGATTSHSTVARTRAKASPAVGAVLLPRGPSEGEAMFAQFWNEHYPDHPFVTEYRFCEERRWRLDFAWPKVQIAVEYEGYGHGKDNRYLGDVEKYNALSAKGWVLFRCTSKHIMTKRIAEFCEMVHDLMWLRFI